ncbi:MAG: hypothetical protein ABJK83_07700, partial [Parasphingorhabdus sp.]|uniref:hypothetical protein n=1 Tax=Parasphingorhabdus sp. TaxID=2709688 RepID=UPI00329707EE
ELFENLRNEHSRAQNKNIEIISQITRAKEKGEDDLALALRLQMLREADVAELMNRYRSLKGENEHLINLLRKVLHNLSFLQASKQNSRKASKRL